MNQNSLKMSKSVRHKVLRWSNYWMLPSSCFVGTPYVGLYIFSFNLFFR